MAKKTMTYQYVSDYAVILFDVEGKSSWSEEEFDSASEFDITCYAKDPQDYRLDDCWIKGEK